MKRRTALYVIMCMLGTNSHAQSVSYNHDSAKQNQFTVAEIGSGGLTPTLYYDLLHKNYAKTAAQKNKLAYRTTAGVASYWQVDDATSMDSAMTKRAEIEALNMADRSGGALDVAWAAEGYKINSKMSDFRRNIDRIPTVGGTYDQQTLWTEHYNTYLTAIKATQETYMPNSLRKKQYLQIYADVCRKNETLVRYLVHLSNSTATTRLLTATYDKPNPVRNAAVAAFNRWRDAGWEVTTKSGGGTDTGNRWNWKEFDGGLEEIDWSEGTTIQRE